MNRSFFRGCILSLIFVFSCNPDPKQPTSDLSYLPKDAQFFTQVNSWNTFKNKLEEEAILDYIQGEYINEKTAQNLSALDEARLLAHPNGALPEPMALGWPDPPASRSA